MNHLILKTDFSNCWVSAELVNERSKPCSRLFLRLMTQPRGASLEDIFISNRQTSARIPSNPSQDSFSDPSRQITTAQSRFHHLLWAVFMRRQKYALPMWVGLSGGEGIRPIGRSRTGCNELCYAKLPENELLYHAKKIVSFIHLCREKDGCNQQTSASLTMLPVSSKKI